MCSILFYVVIFIIVIIISILAILFINRDKTDKENRIKFYLGDIINNSKGKIDLEEYKNTKILYNNTEELLNLGKNNFPGFNEVLYTKLRELNFENKKFIVSFGDIAHKTSVPSLCKNRYDCNTNTLLKCFDYKRHWDLYYNKPKDINFNNKINKIIWRGATTGSSDKPGNRFKLIEDWFNKNENIDIGFNQICQNKDQYNNYLKNELSPKEMLKYKYILSVEGNDKDSGLNWKLNSNSVILMAKPKVTSWLMETTLIPNYHYVLLKDDFSDLLEKYEWCEKNQDKCKEIVKNANKFMKQFKNIKNENIIEFEVIKRYIDKIN